MQNAYATNRNDIALSGNWISATIASMKARYAQYNKYRETVRELSALSDRALADLGLSRPMIHSLARDAAKQA